MQGNIGLSGWGNNGESKTTGMETHKVVGLKDYSHHAVVNLKYPVLWLYKESRTIILAVAHLLRLGKLSTATTWAKRLEQETRGSMFRFPSSRVLGYRHTGLTV